MKLCFVGNVPEAHLIPDAMVVIDFTGHRIVFRTPFAINRKYVDPLSFEEVEGLCRYVVAFKKLNNGEVIRLNRWVPKYR